MAELIPRGPLDGQVPLEAAGCTLEPLALGPAAMILPFPGRAAAVDAALRARGLGLPAPGCSLELADTRILWAGRAAALMIGAVPPVLPDAAVIDQTDGWAALGLSGHGAEAALARRVPIDLRPAVFAEGAVACTLLGQVQAILQRRGGGFEILVPASFARSAWEDLCGVLRTLAAREAARD